MLELIVLSTFGMEQPDPEGGRCIPPSASMVELFPLFLLVFLWTGGMSLVQGACLWLHRQIVFKTLHDCRVGLGMPLEDLPS